MRQAWTADAREPLGLERTWVGVSENVEGRAKPLRVRVLLHCTHPGVGASHRVLSTDRELIVGSLGDIALSMRSQKH